MSNVTQLTKVKTGLYALITFLFLACAPVMAAECVSSGQMLENLNVKYDGAVTLSQVFIGNDAKNILAAFNASPPESFLEADTVAVYKHKDHPEATLLAFLKGGCIVEAFMLPTAEANKFLPSGA